MNRFAILVLSISMAVAHTAAAAEDTPLHSIAVSGSAELLLPPDYASIELGVVTEAPLVNDALAENSARMTRAIAAVKALGIADKDIRTSTFLIQPKFAKSDSNAYDEQEFRTIVGYFISNKVTVRLKDLSKVAKVIDASVTAGANASGSVSFELESPESRLDEAHRAAVANALHKAQVLTDAVHVHLGAPISITDNEADVTYNNRDGGAFTETVVVTGSRIPTPIEPGLVSVRSTVTIVYATQ